MSVAYYYVLSAFHTLLDNLPPSVYLKTDHSGKFRITRFLWTSHPIMRMTFQCTRMRMFGHLHASRNSCWGTNFRIEKKVLMENQKSVEGKTMCSQKRSIWVVLCLVIGIISIIFARLHARDVQDLRNGCKEWCNLSSSSSFAIKYLCQSNPGLLALPSNMTLPFAVETQYMHPGIIQIKDEEVHIYSFKLKCKRFVEGACNGLVVLEDMESNSWVPVPVNGQILTTHLCIRRSDCLDIKSAITMINFTEEYKAVSVVYNKKTGLIGCEMLVLGSSTWKWVNSTLECISSSFLDKEKSLFIGVVLLILLWAKYKAAADFAANLVVEKKLVLIENQEDLDDKTICNERKSNGVVPYLSAGIISNIFTRLHIPEVRKCRYGCVEWYNLTSSSYFIKAHLRRSNPGLIAIPVSMILPSVRETPYIHPDYIQIKDEDVVISSVNLECNKFVEGACNGLVLLEDKENNLWVSNPVTGQVLTLPPGQVLTLPPCIQRTRFRDIKRAIRFVDSTGEYKVVSVVYVQETGLIGCEVLVLGSSTWKWVYSPFECIFNVYLYGQRFISIGGVFHILVKSYPHLARDGDFSFVVSFDTAEEKFYKSQHLSYWCRHGDLVEIGGCLSIVAVNVDSPCQWDIWALKDLDSGKWDLQRTINLTVLHSKFHENWFQSRIVGAFGNGRFLVVEQRGQIGWCCYLYDVELQFLKPLELASNTSYYFTPHVESLVAL